MAKTEWCAKSQPKRLMSDTVVACWKPPEFTHNVAQIVDKTEEIHLVWRHRKQTSRLCLCDKWSHVIPCHILRRREIPKSMRVAMKSNWERTRLWGESRVIRLIENVRLSTIAVMVARSTPTRTENNRPRRNWMTAVVTNKKKIPPLRWKTWFTVKWT